MASADEDQDRIYLYMGFLSGALSDKKHRDEIVAAIRRAGLHREYVVMCRNMIADLDEILNKTEQGDAPPIP